MKFAAAAILVSTLALIVPATAQDRDQGRDQASGTHDKPDTSMRHRVSHHRENYKRTYKTDEEEHQATEDLNKQYRGVPRSDAH